jgi:hypothetical protein
VTSTNGEREQFADLPILRELRDLLEMEFAAACDDRRRALRRRRWFRGRSRLVVVLAVLLVGGGSAVAAGVFSGQRSAALSGRFSGAKARGPLAGARYAIGLYPNLTAGTVGWCTQVGYGYRAGVKGARIVGSWSCGSATAGVGSPIFAACGCGGTGPWYVLTAPQVAAVRIAGGPTVLTQTDRRLPFGFRAAVIASGRKAPVYELTALDAAGRPIAGTEAVTPVQATRIVARTARRRRGSVHGHSRAAARPESDKRKGGIEHRP